MCVCIYKKYDKGGDPSKIGTPPLFIGLTPLLFFPREEKIQTTRTLEFFLLRKMFFPAVTGKLQKFW